MLDAPYKVRTPPLLFLLAGVILIPKASERKLRGEGEKPKGANEMSDNYLPEWKPWLVTAEELEKLRAKDRTALEAFYFKNLDLITRYAFKYYNGLSLNRSFYTVDDMVQFIFCFLHKINFSSRPFLLVSLKDFFFRSCFSIKDANRGITKQHTNFFFNVRTVLDKPLDNYSRTTFGDILPGGENPHEVLMREYERRRQDRIEADIEPFLRRVFTPHQYKEWSEGRNSEELRSVLRRYSDELLQFLREHGTPAYKLQGQPLTAEAFEAIVAERRAHIKWEEEHLDELDPITREKVLNRLRMRRYMRKKAEKARESV